jgi:hypothetical protein
MRKIMNSPTKVNSNLGRYLARRKSRAQKRLAKSAPIAPSNGFA